MIENWKRILTVKAPEWGLPGGEDWNFLFLNTYNTPFPTINLLWFRGNEQFPRVVTKMCRDDAGLTEEFGNLQTVHHVAPRYVPRPMHLGNADGFCMLWMEGIPGRRIPPGQHGKSVLDASVDMVTSIHCAVNRGKERSAADRHVRMVTTPLNAVLQRGGSAVRERCLALSETATTQWLQSLPVIPQHGDLFPDNILRHEDQCHIVDWENFGTIDLPFYDLLTLLIAFLRASAPKAWDRDLTRAIPSLLERYGRGIKISTSTVSLLLPLAMANLFYLHWIEGKPAAEVVYADIEHYFAHTAVWEKVFLGKEHL